MKKKRRLKKQAVILIIIVLLLIISVLGIVIYNSLAKEKTNKVEVLEEIPEYGYTLDNNDPKIYKKLFKELKEELGKEEIDEKKYAELISQMFAIDFYNLENKVSKNDVGGTQFIKSDYVETFTLKASDTVYKYVQQNIYGDRKQSLPEVNSSSVKKIKKDSYSYKNIKDDNVYIVTVNLKYKKDLDYPKEVTVKLLHSDKKLEIYDMK